MKETIKEVINYGIEDVGFVLFLSVKESKDSSIVIEIPTENQPLMIGNDIEDDERRIVGLVITKSKITGVTGEGEKKPISVDIAKGKPICIYQFGHYPETYWTWEKSEETLLKLWLSHGDDKPELENVLFYVNETIPVWVGYAAECGAPDEQIIAEVKHLKKIIYG